MLAYSTISQLGYVLMALSIFDKSWIDVAFFQIISHGLAKIVLFFLAGILYIKTGSKQISSFNGIANLNPIMGFCLIVSGFSIMGFPFTFGFLFKAEMFRASSLTSLGLVYFTMLFGSILTSIYIFSIIYRAFCVETKFFDSKKISINKKIKIGFLFSTSLLAVSFANIFLFLLV